MIKKLLSLLGFRKWKMIHFTMSYSIYECEWSGDTKIKYYN